jgi:uncharacterized protein (TIGR02679 family)
VQRAIDVGEYLRASPELSAVMEEIRRRYYAESRLPTTVPVTDGQERALVRMGCTRIRGGRLSLDDMEAALGASRFDGGLARALEEWAGGPLRTRADDRSAEAAEWTAFVRRLSDGHAADAPHPVATWLASDARYVRQEWARDGGALRRDLELAVRAAHSLRTDAEPLPLALLANAAAGDPHALDVDRTARRYFDRLLSVLFPEADVTFPLSAEDREKLLAAAGLVVDDISSTVTVANLCGDGPIPVAMQATGLPLTLPLLTVNAMRGVAARTPAVWAVENPAVFRVLLTRLDGVPIAQRPTLVCTSGHLSVAARKLLDLLVGSGATIRYGGDFDPGGLAIARGLLRRYGAAVRLWRMDAEAYPRALKPGAPQPAAGKLNPLSEHFPELCSAIAAGGVAYQESIADVLAEDLLAEAGGRDGPANA